MSYVKQLMIEINILWYIHYETANPNRKGKYSQCTEMKIFHKSFIISEQRYRSNKVKLHPT